MLLQVMPSEKESATMDFAQASCVFCISLPFFLITRNLLLTESSAFLPHIRHMKSSVYDMVIISIVISYVRNQIVLFYFQ